MKKILIAITLIVIISGLSALIVVDNLKNKSSVELEAKIDHEVVHQENVSEVLLQTSLTFYNFIKVDIKNYYNDEELDDKLLITQTKETQEITIVSEFEVFGKSKSVRKKYTIRETSIVPKKYYSIQFLNEDDIYKDEEILENTKIDKPSDPVKTGYRFMGWYLDDELYDFTNLVETDLSLRAKFEKEYKISFIIDSNTYKEVYVIKDEKVSPFDAPRKTGFSFDGWYLKDTSYNFDITFTENTIIEARYNQDITTYHVKFLVDGSSYLEVEVVENTKVTRPLVPTKANHEFLRWDLNGVSFNFNMKITSDITLEAIFIEVNKYSVSFMVDESIYLIKEVLDGELVSEPDAPVKVGYEFSNWKLNDIIYNFNSPVTSDLIITASYTEVSDELLRSVYVDNDWFDVETVKNKTLAYSQPEIKRPDIKAEGGLVVYDKLGFDTIVKPNWEDIGYGGAVLIIDGSTGLITKGFYRMGNYILNEINQAPLSSQTNDVRDINYGSQGIEVLEGEFYIALHSSHPFFQDAIDSSYNEAFAGFKVTSGTTPPITYEKVIRNGNPIKNANNQDVLIPSYVQKSKEIRAIWMSTVYNIDLPKISTNTTYKNEIRTRFDHIKSLGFNTIFFQVRPMNDAFYPSNLAPWSRYVTGVEGVDPGFDVLRFVIDEAHARGIELHAWLNPYRVATSGLSSDNFAVKNPELVLNIGSQKILNPGEPAVITYIRDVIKEIMNNYNDINGIHFDDYFYRSDITNEDQATYNTYKEIGMTLANFRRESVNKVIKGVYEDVEQFNITNNKNVKFGVSPTGIWENGGSYGSKTAGQEHNKALYADSRRWIKEEWLHYILPQLYWPFDKFTSAGNPVAPYATLVDWWSDTVRGTSVDLIIGHGLYRYTESGYGKDWFHPDELQQQLRYIQTKDEIIGSSIFTYNTFLKNTSNTSHPDIDLLVDAITDLKNNYWNNFATTPW